ncbi:MAG: acetyltransferase [marine bacterium B5-7]|nr:MAG: acetyltransferase [marine bacterium B5-7]
MMNKDFKIRRMRADELQIAINWAAQEGWNPGIHDAETFYQADNNGFFIGEIGNQAVSVGSAVAYDDQFAFCGLYIVHPEYRGQGYGIALTRERLRYVGQRNAGIDGVVENIPIYERIGYRLAYHNIRYRGIAADPASIDRRVVPLSQLPIENIETYDRFCFPAKRHRFLYAWINQPDAKALGLIENGQLQGYAVRRRCIEGHKIGPLFADNDAIADALFQALQQDIPGDAIYLDIMETNPVAQRLVDKYNMQVVFTTGRMYLKGQPRLDDEKIFGITTFELG